MREVADGSGIGPCSPSPTCASGPGGGRHVWIGLVEAVPAPLVARLADALAARLPSLDTAPLRTPRTGCLRPPGAPHRLTGAASILAGDPAVLIAPRAGRLQVQRLLDLLGAAPAGGVRPGTRRRGAGGRAPPPRPGAPRGGGAGRAPPPGGAGGGAPLPGRRGGRPADAQAALTQPLPAGADASVVLWRVLRGAGRAGWRLAQLSEWLPDAPGLE